MKYFVQAVNEVTEARCPCRCERKRSCYAMMCAIGVLLAGLGVFFIGYSATSCLAGGAATAETSTYSSEPETESSTTAINMSDPHEAIAREWRDLRSLGCQPTLISVDVMGLLGPRDDLQDKDFNPKRVTVRSCSQSRSFCEAKGHRCVPSEDGVRKKKFAVEFEENGQTHTRWRETLEEVACECRPVG